jgi:hypothetical protein
MGIFNHIEFVGMCPSCAGNRALFRAQCHVATSMDGNEKGIFCCKIYKLGDKLNWYEEDDPRYLSWTLPGRIPQIDGRPNEVIESCHAECMDCGANDLSAIILFRDLRSVRIIKVDCDDNIAHVDCYIFEYLKAFLNKE